ncbi:peptidase M13 [Planctomonas sp. JC2975]|uniref:M13 family metallopeptidase n=1 Tax=Planctomonas sp. JC2975 TaxID=2729626 RepID=UPI001475AF64|nr:M13-type metalloendopeptidase [Planctomonas sp. JC2975]NNC12659.1 peptidase M13 [Planctomonas sp. JC2975]
MTDAAQKPAETGTDSVLDSGILLDELDPGIRPQDDLFRHVNGKWINRTDIPADKARWGSFMILAEESEKAVREIIDAAQDAQEGTEARKFGDLYSSFMDTERIEQLGVSPVESRLALAGNVASIDDLLETIGHLEKSGLSGFYQLFVDNDPGNPERYLVFVEQGGISLPDESYYREEQFAPIRAAFVAHVQRMFELAGFQDAPRRAQNVFDLETAIAKHHWDNVASRDSEKTYNLFSWTDAASLAPEVALGVWRNALGAPDGSLDELVLRQPSFTTGLASLLTANRLTQWTDWLSWRVLHDAAPYLSGDFVDANFDFYGRTLTGTPQIRERWKRGVSLVEGAMGEAVGRVYVEEHFPPESKRRMDILVGNLITAYEKSIRTLDWMGEDTRNRALDKLAKFTPKIGYPVKWRDYSSLLVDPTDLIGNVRRSAEFEFHRELGKIGKPLDRDEWFMTPQTINAYYNPGFNEIVFPAAILQFPFFEPNRDDAANYGAIGAVIGHEIGHGFDDQGSKFDGDGKLDDWWTGADRAAFEKRTHALIAQYDALAPAQVPENHVNGALTIGENIGDLGGLGIAWKAYLLSLNPSTGAGHKAEEPPVIDGLTGAQRFFLSWAQAWQQKGRDAEVVRLLAIDPHSPNEFRCNQIVRNIDAFYDAFDVQGTDVAWLDPEARVSIW